MQNTRQPGGSGGPLLEANDIQKTYETRAGTVSAVDGVSLTVRRGEIVGLLGPNGAGKTTLIKCCLGIVSPTAGSVSIDGIDPFDSPTEAYDSVAAMLEGARNVYWRLTVRENLRFFAGLQGRRPGNVDNECEKILRRVGLTEKADEVSRNLSRGMKQKLSLGCALMRDTPLLFLDEPTLGLDVGAKEELKEEITRLAAERNRGIVVCSHDMDTVREVCDRVVIVDEGRVLTRNEIDDLLDAFSTKTYQIQFADVGDAAAVLETFRTEWDGDSLRVTVPDNEWLYDLMDDLRASGAVVESIDTVQPDLAEIFMEITEDAEHRDSSDADSQASDGSDDGTQGVTRA